MPPTDRIEQNEPSQDIDESVLPTYQTPRWVKIVGILIIVLVVLFIVIHLAGGGFRGHTMPSILILPGLLHL